MKKVIGILTLFIFSCASVNRARTITNFVQYSGGRMGYSACNLKLYDDSTYYWREWTHAGLNLTETGSWFKLNGNYYLQSASNKKGKGSLHLRFEAQEFTLIEDTLRLVSNDSTQTDYFRVYFTLLKVSKSNK